MHIFWYHYNKPATTKYKTPKLTVHYRKICYIVDAIECNVSTFSHNKKDQPRLVIKGKCNSIEIVENLGKTKCIIN